ncbi:DNA glycosylase [Mycena amicta]|nr:DNA glycosylase [Mycena amicta]
MSLVRRTSSRLSSRASPYNTGVTLFKLEDDADSKPLRTPPATPRRQRRVNTVKEEDTMEDHIKMEDEDVKPSTPTRSPSNKKPKTKSSQKSPTKSKSSPYKKPLAKPDPTPAHWREVYDAIREMRKLPIAPVDTMGCHMAQRHETDPRNKRFITLVSLILSAQAKDTQVDPAIINLRETLGGTMSLEAMLAADVQDIKEAIRPVGMGEKKAQYLKDTAEKLRDDFNGDVPQTIEELLTLRGVGPKVGLLTLQNAWDINAGIGVDVHVARITRLLGWHQFKKGKEDKARVSLESWLPKELWRDINPLLVGFGQTICDPKVPRCGECTLGASGLCPSSTVSVDW